MPRRERVEPKERELPCRRANLRVELRRARPPRELRSLEARRPKARRSETLTNFLLYSMSFIN